ncbi:Hint domain-containing protein [Pseudotabrizicola sp. 4114]|uniref:Hint domain-containing protein n=1 Tax=Pseudotabrizicola sp. 4114 TaxID=2817731 RepID=UPI0032B81852
MKMLALETILADLKHGPTAGPVAAGTTMPLCGIISGTPILTLSGVIPVEFVAPGDTVITRSGARTVTAVDIAIVQDASVIRISEGVLGKDRPEADLHVAPRQPLLIRDWRAKALAGLIRAVMPAERLVDGDYIRPETLAEARIVTLRFAEPQVIFAAGLELGCEAG